VRLHAALILLLALGGARADDDILTVAVASNFAENAGTLLGAFQEQAGIEFRLSAASTGQLYAQVINGAPFDVFLAADAERPRRLEELGLAARGSRFTYAEGVLVLRSSSATDCRAALFDPDAGRIAIANPEVAPYGKAAREFLVNIRAWDAATGRIVFGQNVQQAALFASTGNVPHAILSPTLAYSAALPEATCSEDIPPHLHEPILQQAVLLDVDSAPARDFLAFLKTAEAHRIIERAGYRVPQ
jgi:molybdate transport system substrate-binding protein